MIRQVRLLFLIVSVSLILLITGCSSTPEAEPEVVAPVTEEIADAIVEESGVDEEAAAQAALLAADTARLMAELTAAREAAEAVGADTRFPDEFAKISAEYEALLKAQQENPREDYRSQIENLRDSYLALAKLAQAMDMRERIVSAGLQDVDPENFQKGDTALDQAQKLNAEGVAGAQLNEQATIAYDAYFSILAANYEALCQSQRERALAAKEKADSIKSAMAAKDAYAAATGVLSSAESAFTLKNYESAYDNFVKATNDFTAIYDEVFVRRATAEEAIRRAQKKIDASAALAAEADEIAPLQEEEVSTSEDAAVPEELPVEEATTDAAPTEALPVQENLPSEEVATEATPTEELPVQETGAAEELPAEEAETVGGER